MHNEDLQDQNTIKSPNPSSTHYETKEGFNSTFTDKKAGMPSQQNKMHMSDSNFFLKKGSSTPYFKKQMNETGDRKKKKNQSVIKANMDHYQPTESNRNIPTDNTSKFSKTIFNPKIKFFGTIQGGFYKPKMMNQSQSSFRLKASSTNFGQKSYSSQSNFRKTSTIDKKNNDYLNFKNIMNDKNFDMELLNDTYKKPNPLSGRISMTNSQYNMMKNDNKEQIVYTPSATSVWKSSGNNFEVDLDNETENNYINNMLNVSNDDEVIDGEEKKKVGARACNNFYMHYKMLDKVKDQNDCYKSKPSVYTGMLDYCQEKKLLPMKNGIVKNSGNPEDLVVNNYLLGNKYIGMVSEGIEREEYKRIEMKNNNLDEKGGNRIIKSFKKVHRSLNLEKNKICQSLKLLKPVQINPAAELQVLNLNKNSLGDAVVEDLLVTLISNKNQVSQHLNENNLTDKIAEKLATLIFEHNQLKEIYCRWNKITSFGGKKIFEKLQKNPELKVADFSWNLLGEAYKTLRTDNGFIEELCNFLMHNKMIVHLDISNNHFTAPQTVKIAEALRANKTIFGFHFTGNKGYVDSEQFLNDQAIDYEDNYSAHLLHPINGVIKTNFGTMNLYENVGSIKNPCWICDAWIELEFEWTNRIPIQINQDFEARNEDIQASDCHAVFLHFKHENYSPIWMKPDDKGKIYTKQMVPNTRLFFFFSANNEILVSEDYKSINLSEPELVNCRMDDNEMNFVVASLNIFQNNLKSEPFIDPKTYEIQITTKPRDPRPGFIAPKIPVKALRPRWALKTSIFRTWHAENDDMTLKSFEMDWSMGKYNAFIKDDEDREATKEVVRSHYYQQKLCFKNFSSHSGLEKLWAIGSNISTDIFNQMGLLDNKVLKLSSLDIEFGKVVYSTEKGVNNSKNMLVRFEFMEMMIRIAAEVYISTKQCTTYAEACDKFYNTYATPFFLKFDHNPWRGERYWYEQVDYIYTKHMKIVMNIWEQFSGKKTVPGKKAWMSQEEYRTLIMRTELDKEITEREISSNFNFSHMPQIDEIYKDKVFEMNFVEYLEALGRLAEIVSLPSLYYTEEQKDAGIPKEERKAQPLCLKIEAMLYRFMDEVVPYNTIMKYYKRSSTSLFTQDGMILEFEGMDHN